MSVTDKTNLISKDATSERQLLDRTISEEPSNKVKKVELDVEGHSEKEEVSSVSDSSNLGEKNNYQNKSWLNDGGCVQLKFLFHKTKKENSKLIFCFNLFSKFTVYNFEISKTFKSLKTKK